ncbi:hypothetical protein E1B28_000170 [Marasmius oreades]|uniref:Uncharacterized protein n=1 Tax=Marasmius oreades TaxID=181124 RepID=A0A9P8AE23_9AGAR|nr:uncharacterized protein E1B28_000170 [Marasmius oreades]KAG7098202.1 hypothetical protein E1B28_000170 [Marasmius oreades]
MPSNETRTCYCQKYCQAPPEGRNIPLSSWYRHQRALKEQACGEGGEPPEFRRRRKTQSNNLANGEADAGSSTAVHNVETEGASAGGLDNNNNNPTFENGRCPTEPLEDFFDNYTFPSEDFGHNVEEEHVEPTDDFNLDGEETVPATSITLDDLLMHEELLEQIRSYDFEAEREQWNDTEFDCFVDPPEGIWATDDPDIKFSFQCYLSLSAHCSENAYKAVRQFVAAG